MELNLRELPHLLVGSLMEVHKEMGPGLTAEAYRSCFAQELRMREILFKEKVPVTVTYKGIRVDMAFQFDFVVEEKIALQIFSVDAFEQEHKQTLRNHLSHSGLEVGFIVNFNCLDFRKGGLKRIIVSEQEPEMHWRRVDEPESELSADI